MGLGPARRCCKAQHRCSGEASLPWTPLQSPHAITVLQVPSPVTGRTQGRDSHALFRTRPLCHVLTGALGLGKEQNRRRAPRRPGTAERTVPVASPGSPSPGPRHPLGSPSLACFPWIPLPHLYLLLVPLWPRVANQKTSLPSPHHRPDPRRMAVDRHFSNSDNSWVCFLGQAAC